jgi:hypothetical protein
MLKRRMLITYKPGANGYVFKGSIHTGKQKPMIRITNRFLLSSGFRVGDPVEVAYENNIITITKALIIN